MCHSSVIIRKHIDLTITWERLSPPPRAGYLSPWGTCSDEAGSELTLRLRFTPPAVFAPPLAPLFLFIFPLPLHSTLLIPRSTFRLPFSFPSPSLLPPSLHGRRRTATSAALASCSAAPSITPPRLRLRTVRDRCRSTHPCIPPRRREGWSWGTFLAQGGDEMVIHQWCLWTWRVGFASSPPKVCEHPNLLVLASSKERAVTAGTS